MVQKAEMQSEAVTAAKYVCSSTNTLSRGFLSLILHTLHIYTYICSGN